MTEDTTERIEELEAENEELRERLEDIETAIDGAVEEMEEEDGSIEISRRGTLAGLAAAGAIGVGATGSAAAAEAGDPVELGEFITVEGGDFDGFAFAIQNQNTSGDARAVLGITDSPNGRAFVGQATAEEGNTRGLVGRVASPDGSGLVGLTDAEEGDPVGIRALNPGGSPDAVGIESDAEARIHDDVIVDEGGDVRVLGDGNVLVEEDGNLEVAGTKHFAHAVETPAGRKKVRYTSVEAGRALTEISDVAEMEDGRAEIELPDHFTLVTSEEEPLSVQVTPYAKEEVKPQVVEQSPERIVVEDFSDARDEYTFAYTIKGVREGYENEDIIVDDE